MKIQTTFFLLLFTFLTCSPDIYAATKPGAKPTIWEIVEATPKKTNILDDVVDATNLNDVVEATGRKLDYDRTPVDNKVYKTRINPRIPETKAAIGSNAMKKLLRVSGWGFVAVEGLKTLLEGIDWVIDLEAQSIWRHKKQNGTGIGEGLCKGGSVDNYSGKKVEILFWTATNAVGDCPLSAAENQMKYWSQTTGDSYVFIGWLDSADLNAGTLYWEKFFTYKHPQLGNRVASVKIKTGAEVNVKPPEKEILTEQDLADYMLGNHKDFKDDKYKSKLPRENTWTGVSQQFKPENRFEEENSPTVKISHEQLDQALPESEDTTVKPTEPDPITGEKGWKFPPFCSWATPVCDFFQWFKEPLEKDDDQEEPDIDDKGIFSKTFDYVFSLSKQCPPDIPIDFETKYISGSFTFSLKWLCLIFTFLSYPIVFASHYTGIWILYEAVIRKEFRG